MKTLEEIEAAAIRVFGNPMFHGDAEGNRLFRTAYIREGKVSKNDFERLGILASKGKNLVQMLKDVESDCQSTVFIEGQECHIFSSDHRASLREILGFELGKTEIAIKDIVSK